MDTKNKNWTKNVYTTAKRLGFTKTRWSAFAPNQTISSKEFVLLLARIVDYRENHTTCEQ